MQRKRNTDRAASLLREGFFRLSLEEENAKRDSGEMPEEKSAFRGATKRLGSGIQATMTEDNQTKNPDRSFHEATEMDEPAKCTAAPRSSFGRDFLKRNLLTLLLPTREPVSKLLN